MITLIRRMLHTTSPGQPCRLLPAERRWGDPTEWRSPASSPLPPAAGTSPAAAGSRRTKHPWEEGARQMQRRHSPVHCGRRPPGSRSAAPPHDKRLPGRPEPEETAMQRLALALSGLLLAAGCSTRHHLRTRARADSVAMRGRHAPAGRRDPLRPSPGESDCGIRVRGAGRRADPRDRHPGSGRGPARLPRGAEGGLAGSRRTRVPAPSGPCTGPPARHSPPARSWPESR